LAEIVEAISADIGLDREQKAWLLLAAPADVAFAGARP
jgi:hypothetical protein